MSQQRCQIVITRYRTREKSKIEWKTLFIIRHKNGKVTVVVVAVVVGTVLAVFVAVASC